MTDSPLKIGIDPGRGLVYAARVKLDGARPEVLALLRLNHSAPMNHHLLKDGNIVLAVPDNQVMVKQLVLSDSPVHRINDMARFEMLQSQLEDENEFSFDTINTGRDHRYLGLIMRRQLLDQLSTRHIGQNDNDRSSVDYRGRAVALGKGYLNFCRREAGDLVCLVDFGDKVVSLCFIYQQQIVALAHLVTDLPQNDASQQWEKLALEFKTVLNFRLASLFDDGISVPLSAIIVSGEGITDTVMTTMRQYLSMELTTPKINTGFFADPSNLTDIPIECYLVSLGLTVE